MAAITFVLYADDEEKKPTPIRQVEITFFELDLK